MKLRRGHAPGRAWRRSSRIVAIFALSVGLFRGSFTETVPVTVISDRAGLVMNPDAKVKMRGVQVGKVESIEYRPDGKAALHLAMDPSQLHLIPANVNVDIASSTVFGAKFVELDAAGGSVAADAASRSGARRASTSPSRSTPSSSNSSRCSTQIDPAKLNETLGAIAQAFNGRGEKFGQTLTDFNALLAKLEPSLPNLAHDIETAPPVLNAYADAAPDLIATIDNATTISNTIVDEQDNLDAIPGQRNRSGRHRQRGDRRQPAGADRRRCTCWCPPPICSTSTASR